MLCALILAGGTGKRFWPLSTEEQPKQLLKIFSDKSMVRETVDRILPLISADKIYVATNTKQLEAIKRELPMIEDDNFIVEPEVRDTAAAIGYAAAYIQRALSNVTLATFPSDHLVRDEKAFIEAIKVAVAEAEKSGAIVTLGSKPTRAEVGYGYIQLKSKDFKYNLVTECKHFREKPTLEKAEEYFNEGDYLWNSGICVFQINTILEQIGKHLPKHTRVLKNLKYYLDQDLTGIKLSTKAKLLYEDFEKISIDYGVLEKSDKIKVIPIDIGWFDIGSYSAFEDIFESDEFGNTIRDSNVRSVDCSGNIILTENLEIKAVGLDNIIVVQSGNKLLLCDKNKMDLMKEIV